MSYIKKPPYNKSKAGLKAKTNKVTKPPSTNRGRCDKEGYPHFRRYKKSNHPALILSEYVPDEYNFRKVMHSERDGKRLNEKVEPNPDPTDKRPMYIGKRVRHDKKQYFGNRLPWKYPKKGKKK